MGKWWIKAAGTEKRKAGRTGNVEDGIEGKGQGKEEQGKGKEEKGRKDRITR